MDKESFEKLICSARLSEREKYFVKALFDPNTEFDADKYREQHNFTIRRFGEIRSHALAKVGKAFLEEHYDGQEKPWFPHGMVK